MTLDQLKAFGADTETGLQRCINNEDFYLTLVKKALSDDSFDKLKEAIDTKDYDTAFEISHALKGVLANLALTPLADPVIETMELLRNRTDMDYTPLMDTVLQKYAELKEML